MANSKSIQEQALKRLEEEKERKEKEEKEKEVWLDAVQK